MTDAGAQEPGERTVGESADGVVRVELDDSGRLADLALDTQVMSLHLAELRYALITAIQRAQDVASGKAKTAATGYGGVRSRERLESVLADATAAADQRFNEMSGVLYDLDRRAGRHW